MAYENVILVDKDDNMIGTMEKLAAHKSGKLHRAISVFLFNKSGQMLLQQRSNNKYHSGGKWSNACCSHPRPGEKSIDAANRRLKEEVGIECDLEYAFNFTYRAELDNGLIEHEYDHVFLGIVTDSIPVPDPSEVKEVAFIALETIKSALERTPDAFTIWFKIAFEQVIEHFEIKANE